MNDNRPSLVGTIAGISGQASTEAPVATALAVIAAVVMALLHVAQTFVFFLPSGQFKNFHLGLAMIIVFLALIESTPRQKRAKRILLGVLALLAVVPVAYIHFEYTALVEDRTFVPNTLDMIMGVILFAVACLSTALQWGWTIPMFAVVGVIYGYYGYLMPGELFSHGGISIQRLVGYTSIPYFQGLLGGLTGLSAGTIFMFMLFAGVLRVTGGIDFIIKISYTLGGRSRAGPAQVAVLSSGFMAMISGSTVANVASTGAVTIPMMKRFGFRPEFAGAVEAVASTGGQFTPPVMGLAAFLIIGITGIPYYEIMVAAAFPALIYYLYLMVAVHIQAAKYGLDAKKQLAAMAPEDQQTITLREAILEYGHLLIGIAVLIYFLSIQMPPGTAALYSLMALLALEATKRIVLYRRDPRRAIIEATRLILRGLEQGARSGAMVATVIAVIGVLIEVLSVTGFAQKLSNMMLELSGGDLVSLLIMAMFTCLAFGLGLPTTASYILVALLGAPSLVELGVPLLATHFFVFYFANVSNITPPVAICSLIGSNIAGANFTKTAFIGMRLGLPGFLLPYLFIAHPEILGLDTTFLPQFLIAAAALIAVVSLNLAMEGYFLSHMAVWERIILLPAAFGLLWPGWVPTAVGLALVTVVLIRQLIAVRTASRQSGVQ